MTWRWRCSLSAGPASSFLQCRRRERKSTTSYLSFNTDVNQNIGNAAVARGAAGMATSYLYDTSGADRYERQHDGIPPLTYTLRGFGHELLSSFTQSGGAVLANRPAPQGGESPAAPAALTLHPQHTSQR